jgi:hypothetical protein
MSYIGMYVCGNCAYFRKCLQRIDPDQLDFPCGNPLFLTDVKR